MKPFLSFPFLPLFFVLVSSPSPPAKCAAGELPSLSMRSSPSESMLLRVRAGRKGGRLLGRAFFPFGRSSVTTEEPPFLCCVCCVKGRKERDKDKQGERQGERNEPTKRVTNVFEV